MYGENSNNTISRIIRIKRKMCGVSLWVASIKEMQPYIKSEKENVPKIINLKYNGLP